MLPAVCVEQLRKHRQRQLEERLKAGGQWCDTGLVFTTYTHRGPGERVGAPLHPRNVLRVFAVDVSAQVSTADRLPAAQQKPTIPPDTSGKVMLLFNVPPGADHNVWTKQMAGPATTKTPTGVATFVDPAVLEKSFTDLMQTLGVVFAYSRTTVGGFALDEVQLHLGLTAEGKIGILGSGVTVAGESSITVTLRRPKP